MAKNVICLSSPPFHRVSDHHAAYRLLKLRPLILDLILSDSQTLFHGHLPRIWHSFTKLTTSLLICPLSDLTAYCPSGTWLRLCLRKTLASTDFAFSEYLVRSHSSLSVYRPNMFSCTRLGLSIYILPLSNTVLLNLILLVLSYDLMTLLILLSDYFTLLVNNLSISTLLTIANMLYCSSCLLNPDLRLRLTLLTHSALTPMSFHSNSHYHHQHCIAHTLQNYCLWK